MYSHFSFLASRRRVDVRTAFQGSCMTQPLILRGHSPVKNKTKEMVLKINIRVEERLTRKPRREEAGSRS